MRQEDKVVSIKVKKEADLILDRNLLEINIAKIREAKVKATYL
jgi:hypothetical protein